MDKEYGGYLTCFDEAGNPTDDTDKYIVTQTRMICGLAAMYEEYPREDLKAAAKQGYDFFVKYFWDKKNEGWYWKVQRDGTPLVTDIGNPRKAIYHTGRAMPECKRRLEKIVAG